MSPFFVKDCIMEAVTNKALTVKKAKQYELLV